MEKSKLKISEIHSHDVLWNKRNKKYKDRFVSSKARTEIAKKIGKTGTYV